MSPPVAIDYPGRPTPIPPTHTVIRDILHIPSLPVGCICPPGANKECERTDCPRKALLDAYEQRQVELHANLHALTGNIPECEDPPSIRGWP